MKTLRTITLALAVVVLAVAVAFAAGSVEKGKALFNDPQLGGGTSGKSCNSCHPNGKGLEGAGEKKELKTPGGTFKTLPEAVNICISMALKGKPIDVNSNQMQDIVAYIKSLKGKAPAEQTKKKKAVEGC